MKRMTQLGSASVLLASTLLTGCYTSGGTWYDSDSSHWWSWRTPAEDYGRDGGNNNNQWTHRERPASRPVVVSPGYHLSQSSTPVGHGDRDKSWVNGQDPNAYTIEVARGASPADAAKALHQSPKTQRGAQLIYQENGQRRSTAVYGSYKTKEEADAALSSLPADVKGSARVSNWSEVQTVAKDSSSSEGATGASRPGPASVGQ